MTRKREGPCASLRSTDVDASIVIVIVFFCFCFLRVLVEEEIRLSGACLYVFHFRFRPVDKSIFRETSCLPERMMGYLTLSTARARQQTFCVSRTANIGSLISCLQIGVDFSCGGGGALQKRGRFGNLLFCFFAASVISCLLSLILYVFAVWKA